VILIMRVGIIEFLTDASLSGALSRLYSAYFRKQFVSIGPQAVAVWCRQLGHDVHYATYYGQNDPASLLPNDLDVAFFATHTPSSALAYAVAKRFRRSRVLTVIGGPHAKSFPYDCLRFFDIVVKDADRPLIQDILQRHVDHPAIVTSGRSLTDIPSVAERLPEIRASAFVHGQPALTSIVPMLSSVGCPYSCNFCADWNSTYVTLPLEQLREDLRYVSERLPGCLIAYHDPNFAVRFDQTMDVIETIPEHRRNGYIMESSLSILKPSRLRRLKTTNCVYAAPGIESWEDYSAKAASSGLSGARKLEQVVSHLEELCRFVPGVQANFLFGSDADCGAEPVELTKTFIRRLPLVWSTINIPTPFGATPLYDQYLHEGRILRTMPFAFYYNPYLAITLKHYGPLAYYDHLIDMHETMACTAMLVRRLVTPSRPAIRFIHSLRTFAARRELAELREIRKLLATDPQFRAFHEGRSNKVPEFYHQRLDARLGPYVELLSRPERIPLLHEPGRQSPIAPPEGIGTALDRPRDQRDRSRIGLSEPIA
jgi:hypothetical protein